MNKSLLPKADVFLVKNFFNDTSFLYNSFLKDVKWEKIKYGEGNPSRLPSTVTDTCYTTKDLDLNLSRYLKSIGRTIKNYFNFDSSDIGLNYYPNGSVSLLYHQDDDCIGDKPMSILSIGESRHIWFRDLETKQEYSILLENGDLLIFSTNSQKYYEHSIKKELDRNGPRFSICFRPGMK